MGGLPHKQYEIDQSIKSNFISVFSYQTMAPTKSSVIGVFLLSTAFITCRGHIWSRNRFISWSSAAVEFFFAIYSILFLLITLSIFFEITQWNKISTKTIKIRIRALLSYSYLKWICCLYETYLRLILRNWVCNHKLPVL